MVRKILSVLTLVVFLLFSFSCTIHRISQQPIKTIISGKEKRFEMVGVLLKNEGKIEFSAENPAKVENGFIIGQPINADESTKLMEHLVILKSNIVNAIRSSVGEDIIEIMTKDGEKLLPVKGTLIESSDKVEFMIYMPASIPVSQVNLVWLRKVDIVNTFFASLAGGAGFLLVIALVGMSGGGSLLGGGFF